MYANYEGWELSVFDISQNYRSYQFQLIKDFIKGKTAEVGPGNGININFYLNKVESLDLYEPTKKLFDNLKEKFLIDQNHNKQKKINIFNRTFLGASEKYDTIIYLDVLEHIKDDKKEFINAFDNLKEGGYLIINVPAFNILYSEFDKDVQHHKRYNKKDFKELLNFVDSSYSKLKYYDSLGFFLSFFSKFLLNKNYKNNFEKKISIWNKLIPISKFLDKLIFHFLGKSLMVVVKK